MDMFYKHNVLNIVKKPLFIKQANFSSVIVEYGRKFSIKLILYKKIAREIFRFYSNILVVIYCIYKKSIKA